MELLEGRAPFLPKPFHEPMMLMHEIFHTNFPSPGKCTLQFWRAVAVCPHEGDAQEDVPWPSPLLVSAFAASSCRDRGTRTILCLQRQQFKTSLCCNEPMELGYT